MQTPVQPLPVNNAGVSPPGGMQQMVGQPPPVAPVPVTPAASMPAPVSPAGAIVAGGGPTQPGAPVANPGKCTPKCTWHCGTRQCDQVCTPNCQSPRCQTRCQGVSTLGCKMECSEPQCTVLCPPTPCAGTDCPGCAMQCGKPSCNTVCPPNTNQCEQICEKPVCNWKCTAPLDCPKPTCSLECDPPKPCDTPAQQVVSLPPLQEGHMVVESFNPPMALQQQLATHGRKAHLRADLLTVQVTVTRATAQGLVHSNVTMPVVASSRKEA